MTNKEKLKLTMLIDAVDKFAMGMNMTVREFNIDIARIKTGMEPVGGNDGVKLGTRKVRGL